MYKRQKITHEAPGVKTFRLRFKDEKEGEAFHFKAGQFGEYSAFGEGLSLIHIYRCTNNIAVYLTKRELTGTGKVAITATVPALRTVVQLALSLIHILRLYADRGCDGLSGRLLLGECPAVEADT